MVRVWCNPCILSLNIWGWIPLRLKILFVQFVCLSFTAFAFLSSAVFNCFFPFSFILFFPPRIKLQSFIRYLLICLRCFFMFPYYTSPSIFLFFFVSSFLFIYLFMYLYIVIYFCLFHSSYLLNSEAFLLEALRHKLHCNCASWLLTLNIGKVIGFMLNCFGGAHVKWSWLVLN